MDSGGFSWSIITIVGPILLLAALAYVMLRNRSPRPDEVERTEKATHDLYDEEDAARRREDDGTP